MFSIAESVGSLLIEVREDIDFGNAEAFDRTVRLAEENATDERRVVISFEYCQYIDSSALGTILKAWKRMGDRLRVVVPPESSCYLIFKMTGLTVQTFVVPSLAEALAA